MGGEDITSQTLTEVLDHVVTLWLTMDEDIQVEFLLDLDNVLDLLLDELLVLLSSNLTLGELVSLNTDLRGLGERANGSGWEHGEVEFLLLDSNTGREFRLALVHISSDSSLSLLDLGVVSVLGGGTSLDRLGVGLEGLTDGSRAVSDSLGDDNQFTGLLDSEAEPVVDLSIKVLLARESVGCVEQGTGGSDDHTVLSELLDGELNGLDGPLEVSLPDVSAIDNTSREDLLGSKSTDYSLELLGVADEVDVDGVEALEVGENINVVDNVTEVGGEDKLGGLVTESTERLVGRLEGSLDGVPEIKDQDWLINLDRLSTSLLQLGQKVNVERNELLNERNRVNFLATISLGESQERDGTEEDWAGDNAGLLGLLELDNRLGSSGELEDLVVLQGRLDIVVV